MKEDILRVMKLLEEGKIDSERAAELIDALKESKQEAITGETTKPVIDLNDDRMFRVKVRSVEGDDVNVQIPLKFVKGVLAACGRIPLNIEGLGEIDMNALSQAIDSGLTGRIVDVKSSKGDIVEIYVD